MSKSLFTIRKKKKERHPHIIIYANRVLFKALKLTHSSKSGKRNNIKLKKNPNSLDKRDSYASKRIIEDFKFRFSKAFKNYSLSNEDIEQLKSFLDRKKKK